MFGSPLRTAILVMLCYASLMAPTLKRSNLDFSTFIVAGDNYVSKDRVDEPIVILENSYGYDGQFFYRFALAPFLVQDRTFGIKVDIPEKRMARIFYPLIVWAVTLGNAPYVPFAMFAVNVVGLGAIGAALSCFARKISWLKYAIVPIIVWPGFVATLHRDTAEIVTVVFLLLGILHYIYRKYILYLSFLSCAILKREAAAPVFAGLAIWEIWRLRRDSNNFAAIVASILSFVPFGLWRLFVFFAWHGRSSKFGVEGDVGPPFVGALRMIYQNLSGARAWSSNPIVEAHNQDAVVFTAILLLMFIAFVFVRGLSASLRDRGPSALFASWLPAAGLISLLTAEGPWIEPWAYFRALTECYVVGCLALASGGYRLNSKLYVVPTLAGLGVSYWFYCNWPGSLFVSG